MLKNLPKVKVGYYNLFTRLTHEDTYSVIKHKFNPDSGKLEITAKHPDFREQVEISLNLKEILGVDTLPQT